jgi:predicted phosphohydrolase
MALYAIGDLHLSLGGSKPMDVFSGWENYVRRLEENWRSQINSDDMVVIAGDTSWAMCLEDCEADFAFIERLPGRKLLLKGNHDYWWATRALMEKWVAGKGFESIMFLHNSAECYENVLLCGTRGWQLELKDAHDEKISAREVQRLAHSLQAAKGYGGEGERLVFLHYPPVWPGGHFGRLCEVMAEYGVQRCFYGHLHGAMRARAVQGQRDGINYTLISADALGFSPLPIALNPVSPLVKPGGNPGENPAAINLSKVNL